MLQIYDLGMRMGRRAIFALSKTVCRNTASKFLRFILGQKRTLKEVASAAAGLDRSLPTLWLHAASLGEFGIARPIIRMLKEKCDCNIVVTFFSPTGYEALMQKQPEGIDAVLYLPFDTSSNTRKFLNEIRPDCAVFMVSEYWHNYLHELHCRNIPTYLVSAVIRENSPFFRWYGNLYRQSIRYFKEIFVLNERSHELLTESGLKNVVINGDPLFDNVALVASTPWEDQIVKNFVGEGNQVFIAGSLHDDEDLELVTQLANRHREVKFIIVPHEISASIMRHLQESLDGKIALHSQSDADTDLNDTQILIIDFVGALAYIYRYANIAYVGGGFTKLLHSVIEPAVYGMPVAFGPNVSRKAVTQQMIKLGIGEITSTPDELEQWFEKFNNNPDKLRDVSEKAAAFVKMNVGATNRVVNKIQEDLCAKK